MELSRRHALAGAAVALAGCSEIEERADGIRSSRGHPLSGTTSVSIVDRSHSGHDLQRLTTEALTYWTANAEEFLDFSVTFELASASPDLEVVFLADAAELEGCAEHATEEILGCAPLLEEGHRPERPVTIEVVAGDRPHGEVRITTKHELGHALGLTHDDEPAYVMSNDIEDRLPEYDRRTEILNSIENAWTGRNAGTRRYNRAVERWNDGEYGAAASGFDSSAERYRVVVASVETAAELETGFDGMNRPETVDRGALRTHFERIREWIEPAKTRSERMAEAASARERGDVSTAQERIAEAETATEELDEIDFPAPADAARALGLVRRSSADETAA